MSKIVSISEASSIAIHSLVLIARATEKLNVSKISAATGTSKHHVAKVLQRLAKDDFLTSGRGPNGGFSLKGKPEDITLLQIYESIEGPVHINKCPLDYPVCAFDKCLMSNIVHRLSSEFRMYLQSQTLDKLI